MALPKFLQSLSDDPLYIPDHTSRRDRRNIPSNYAPGLLHGYLDDPSNIHNELDMIRALAHGRRFWFWRTGSKSAQDLEWLRRNHHRLYSYSYNGVRISTSPSPSDLSAPAHIIFFGDKAVQNAQSLNVRK